MDNQIRKHLYDVLSSIEAINFHLGEKRNFFEYRKNLTVKRAVERELEIIGEAINRILKTNADFELTHARKIVDLRNYIIHSYDTVDDEIIWGIVNRHIPLLKSEIEIITNH
ncbi:MAG: HepT-like ribonuclease domain-containing protein [Bacteroidota bacterium]|nr:HepT-like ribonuclease domain-containing protein [Bacteroidota bacterium]